MSINCPTENSRGIRFFQEGVEYFLPIAESPGEFRELLSQRMADILKTLKTGEQKADIYFDLFWPKDERKMIQKVKNIRNTRNKVRKKLIPLANSPTCKSHFNRVTQKSFLSFIDEKDEAPFELNDDMYLFAPALISKNPPVTGHIFYTSQKERDANEEINLKMGAKILLENGVFIRCENILYPTEAEGRAEVTQAQLAGFLRKILMGNQGLRIVR